LATPGVTKVVGIYCFRKALRIRYINGMEVHKKRPREFEKRPRGYK
jgi:hypothetical protein